MMHCYEIMNCDSFINLSLAVIFVVFEQLAEKSEDEAILYNEKVKHFIRVKN